MIDLQQPPPHALEAEQAFLSSSMQSRELRVELTPEHFFIPRNRTIFEALEQALREGRPVEPIAFSDYLESRKLLEPVGGRAYVSELYAMVPSPALVEHYAQILKEKYLLREVIAKCTHLVRVAQGCASDEDETAVRDVLEQTQAALTEIIIRSQQKETIRHISEGEDAAYKATERAFKNRGDAVIAGIATNFYDFDRSTTGLMPGQFVVLGARPSQGKTSLALNFAANIALTNQVPVGLFSLEMSYEQLWQRLLSYHSKISRQRWRDGYFSPNDLPTIKAKAAEMSKARLWIDDTPKLSVHQFRARARLMKLRFDVQAIIVDYVQIMTASKVRGGQDPRIEVNEISGALKSVAKELGIVVIACAQLNRNTEDREFAKPRMSDLKESGALEQDADIVAMLWRPCMHVQTARQRGRLARDLELVDDDGNKLWSVKKDQDGKLIYDSELTDDQIKERDAQIEEYASLIIVKQRDGPTADIRLRFVKDLTRFESTTDSMWSNNPAHRQQNVKPKPAHPVEQKPAIGDVIAKSGAVTFDQALAALERYEQNGEQP